jgi:methylase of polypeptide subunit release factors
VVGVDVDAAALDLARAAAQGAGLEAELVDDDAARPIASSAFDLAYARARAVACALDEVRACPRRA